MKKYAVLVDVEVGTRIIEATRFSLVGDGLTFFRDAGSSPASSEVVAHFPSFMSVEEVPALGVNAPGPAEEPGPIMGLSSTFLSSVPPSPLVEAIESTGRLVTECERAGDRKAPPGPGCEGNAYWQLSEHLAVLIHEQQVALCSLTGLRFRFRRIEGG